MKTCIQARPGGTGLSSSYVESRGQSGTPEIPSLKTEHKLKPVDPDQAAKLSLSSFSSVYSSEGHRIHRITGTLGNVSQQRSGKRQHRAVSQSEVSIESIGRSLSRMEKYRTVGPRLVTLISV